MQKNDGIIFKNKRGEKDAKNIKIWIFKRQLQLSQKLIYAV